MGNKTLTEIQSRGWIIIITVAIILISLTGYVSYRHGVSDGIGKYLSSVDEPKEFSLPPAPALGGDSTKASLRTKFNIERVEDGLCKSFGVVDYIFELEGVGKDYVREEYSKSDSDKIYIYLLDSDGFRVDTIEIKFFKMIGTGRDRGIHGEKVMDKNVYERIDDINIASPLL